MNTRDQSTNSKVIEADETTTGVEMHKDSRFSQSWQNFKDSNPVMNKFVDYRLDTRLYPQFNGDSLVFFSRVKFEESDSALARGARLVTDKVTFSCSAPIFQHCIV